MEVKVNAIKFDATEKLQEFVEKKASKLGKLCEEITAVEVRLKVEKPATNGNKQASVTVELPGEKFFVEKEADTFEEATTQALLALEKQVMRFKEKIRGK